MGCDFLLQGFFQSQGSNPRLLHCGWILYHWTTREASYRLCSLKRLVNLQGFRPHFLTLLDFSIFCLILIYTDSQLRVVNSKTGNRYKVCSLSPCMLCPVSRKADRHKAGGDDDEVMNYWTFITKQTQTFPNSFLLFCFWVAWAPLDAFLKPHWLTEGRGNPFLSSVSLLSLCLFMSLINNW